MSTTFTFEDAFSEPALINADPKIRQLQDLDRWKAEKAHQLPLEFKVKDVSFGEPSSKKESWFVMQVTANDSSWQVAFGLRDLKELTLNLQRAFPIEAGKVGNHKCIIPKPPINLKRSFWSTSKSIEKVRRMQLEMIRKYMEELLLLPEYIRHSKLIVEFFLHSAPSPPNPTPPPSSIGEPSLSFESSSHPSRPSTPSAIKRIKVKIGDELAFIAHEPQLGLTHLKQLVQEKFSVILGNSFQCPASFKYSELEGCDEIVIEDDEDLEIACKICPMLVLSGQEYKKDL